MARLTIGSLKRHLTETAATLSSHGIPVYTALLAREATCVSRSTLRNVLCYVHPEWKAELAIVDGRYNSWNKTLVYGLYEKVAKFLLQEDLLPTANNLAKIMHLTPCAIWSFMNHHRDLAEKILYSSENECLVYCTGRKIRFRGEPVTRQAIARETRLDRSTVRSILKKRWHFYSVRLALKEPPKKRIVTRKSRGPSIPEWLKHIHKISRTRFPSSMHIEERILVTVCERHGVTAEEVMEKKSGGTGHRAGYARNLASYFLIEDAKLTAREAGEVLGGRCAELVRCGRRAILKDVHRSCVQVELRILRNRFSRI